jgi:hypothetical protein
MRNWKPSPEVAATELLRRRREGLLSRYCNAVNELSSRTFGKRYEDLDSHEELDFGSDVAIELMAQFTTAELHTLAAFREKHRGDRRSSLSSESPAGLSDEELNGLYEEAITNEGVARGPEKP